MADSDIDAPLARTDEGQRTVVVEQVASLVSADLHADPNGYIG